MKKLSITCVIVLLAGLTNAQIENNQREGFEINPSPEYQQKMNQKSGDSSAWYNAYYLIEGLSTTLGHYHRTHPDTNIRESWSDGTSSASRFLSKGQVFDPTSPLWRFMDFPISEEASFMLDSLAIHYYYHRADSNITDTMLIQIFTEDQMTYHDTMIDKEMVDYCKPQYDYTSGRGLNPEKEIKVPLGDADAGNMVKYVGVNHGISAGSEVAVTVHMIAGRPTGTQDTIYNWKMGQPRNVAYLGMYARQDYGRIHYPEHYDHSLEIFNFQNGFNQAWTLDFVPGIVRTQGWHTDIGFKITFDPLAGIEQMQQNSDWSVYPNPARDVLNISGLTTATSGVILDQLGQVVGNFDLTSGQNSIDVSYLNPGMYLMRIEERVERIVIE